MGKRAGKKAAQSADGKPNVALYEKPNVAFYKGELCSSEGGIAAMHAWKKDYKTLEENHAYIQWLFPNYFDSKFNSDSRALTPEEAHTFREDLQIAKSYVKSYQLFLDFLGLELVDERSGLVRRTRGGAGRLRKALVQHVHNHLRLRRLLSSLAVTGFRRYVAPLAAHLEWEILGRNEGVTTCAPTTARGEAPALPELAKAASKSEEPLVDLLVRYAKDVEADHPALTKALPADRVDSVFLRGKDENASRQRRATDAAVAGAGTAVGGDAAVGPQGRCEVAGDPVQTCIACAGSGEVIVLGVCPLCDGMGFFE